MVDNWVPSLRRKESFLISVAFQIGGFFVLASVALWIWRHPEWPPMDTGVLLGVSLLLLVACERLGTIANELQMFRLLFTDIVKAPDSNDITVRDILKVRRALSIADHDE